MCTWLRQELLDAGLISEGNACNSYLFMASMMDP